MTTPTTRAERIAGLVLVLAALGWGAGVVARSRTQDWFHHRPRIVFTLAEAHDLAAGARVLMSGVPVGSVSSVELTDQNTVSVALEILPGHADRLRAGLRAEVIPPPLFGSTEISLLPGKGEGMLLPGTEIPVTVRGDTTKSFSQVAERMAALGDHLEGITRGIRDGEGTLGALLTDQGKLHGKMGDLVESARDTLQKLQDLGGEASGGIADARQILPQIGSEVERFGKLSEQLSQAVRELDRVLSSLSGEEKGLPAVLQDTRVVLGEVRDAVQMLAQVVPETAESANLTTSEARRLIRATERNFLIRPHLEPIPAAETSVSGSRRWDPYED